MTKFVNLTEVEFVSKKEDKGINELYARKSSKTIRMNVEKIASLSRHPYVPAITVVTLVSSTRKKDNFIVVWESLEKLLGVL